MKKISFIIILGLIIISGKTQTLGIQAGISPCMHIPTTAKFNKVYPGNHFTLKGNFGIRANNFMLISKYKYYSAIGNSIVENANIIGYAEWEQHFTFIGIRGYVEEMDNIFYSELGLLLTSGSELIDTEEKFEDLYAYNEFNEIGFQIGMGFDFPVLPSLIINAEAEAGCIFTPSEGGIKKRPNVNIGGLTFSIGLVYNISNQNDEE